MLFRAVQWSRRSLELAPNATYYDTLARLLYRLKFYSEADENELKAIRTSAAKSAEQREFKKALAQIKSRTL